MLQRRTSRAVSSLNNACHKQSLTGDFLCVLVILPAMLRFNLWAVAFLLSSMLGALGHSGYLDCAASRVFEGVSFVDLRSLLALPVPGLNATCDGNPTRASNLDTIRKSCDEALQVESFSAQQTFLFLP